MNQGLAYVIAQGVLFGATIFSLVAALGFKKLQEEQKAWLLMRIEAEMGPVWWARFKNLPLDQLWLQFTYDVRK